MGWTSRATNRCWRISVKLTRLTLNSPYQLERLLTLFIQRVGENSDTPSLITLVAADADFLWLCREILDPAAEPNPTFDESLACVCRQNGMNPLRLKEKLTPAAGALGLMQSVNSPADYYRLLGVRPQANAQEIKKAFRRKVVKVHPDANASFTGGSQRFVELNDAYRTLRDPVLRQQYDTNRHHLMRWYERSGLPLPMGSKPAVVFWYLCALFFIFTLLLIFIDLIVF
jgi:hypothetical protein